jgi:tRNA-dihydrouridine synthase
MVGRTAASNPWIFRQIAQYTAMGRYDEPGEADRYEMIRTYFRMLIAEQFPDAPGKMKQFASWFTHGVPGGAALRKAIYEAKQDREILKRVEDFFEARLQSASTHTDVSNATMLT